MKKIFFYLLVILPVIVLTTGCSDDDDNNDSLKKYRISKITSQNTEEGDDESFGFEYGPDHRLKTFVEYEHEGGDWKKSSWTTFTYNAEGKLVRNDIFDVDYESGEYRYIEYTYGNNTVVAKIVYKYAGMDEYSYIYTFLLDSNGRMLSEEYNGKPYYTCEYDGKGNLVKIVDSYETSDFEYDNRNSWLVGTGVPQWFWVSLEPAFWGANAGQNNPVKYTDSENSASVSYTYDSNNYPIEVYSDGEEFATFEYERY